MGRKVLAVVTALIVVIGIIFLGEMIMLKYTQVPVIAGKNPPEADAMRPYFASVSMQGLAFLFSTYVVASFLGGFVSIKMARRWTSGMNLPVVTGTLIALLAVIDLFGIVPYYPIWARIVCILLCVPLALLGYRFARLPKDAYPHSVERSDLTAS